MSKKLIILNSAGKPVELNERQVHNAKWMARSLELQYGKDLTTPHLNSLGYEAAITTLTTISKKVSEQKFYQIPFADYVPVKIGEGTWSTSLTTFRSFDVADQFETGIMNTGGQNSRMATADAAVDALNIKVFPWAKSIGYSIIDLEFAAKSGNWDLVQAKEKARKRNWDLGLQRIAFLGARGSNYVGGTCFGLLNQPGVNVNTTTITQKISAMSPSDLKTFVTKVIDDYRVNNNHTVYPSHFIVPESDYNGMAAQASADFPIKSVKQLLEEAFQEVCQNKSFKILPSAYADAAQHADVSSIAGKQVYTLLNYDEESIRMDLPLDYTTTLANSLDNFSFQNAGYGQFTGVLAYRPLEVLYFQY